MTSRSKAPLILLGLLTAIQAGTAFWRVTVMFQEAAKVGARPFLLSLGLAQEVGLSAVLAFAAWWWLPRGTRSAAGWAVRFLVFAWLLALGHLAWVVVAGYFAHAVTWLMLGLLLLGGTLVRQRSDRAEEERPPAPPGTKWHPALYGSLVFWLLQLPHLFFPYHWTDTKDIWACRTVAFELRGDLSGIFDCLDPGRPPLHSILLWLGHTNGSIEGRLLPFLMVGAFGLVVYRLLTRVAPRVAPWGLLWFFMTVRVYQGAVSNYADVPTLIAIGVAVVLAVQGEKLVGSRQWAVAFAIIAALAATLIKRDGGALLVVSTAVLFWFAARRREPRLYAPLIGAALGFVLWAVRPADLYVPDVFAPRPSTDQSVIPLRRIHPTLALGRGYAALVSTSHQADTQGTARTTPAAVVDSTKATLQTYVTMFYGMQGQVLSHYGYSMFVPAWIILAIWLWRRGGRLSPEARLWGWLGLVGWLAIVGIYVVHASTGHPYRGSLYVIRTAFGRHLVHMFLFGLLHATALTEGLIGGPGEDVV